MKAFLERNRPRLRNLSLVAMIGLPFLLYFAATGGSAVWTYLLLGLLGLTMLIAMRVG